MNAPNQALKAKNSAFAGLSTTALYRAHSERSFGNPLWSGAPFRFLIVRLSPFAEVERSSPHSFLFRELRHALPEAYIDFSFFPSSWDRKILEEQGVPLMHGIASGRGAIDFDVILISNAYTLELVNLPLFLKGSGLPVSLSEREKGRYPILVMGGSNAFASAAASKVRIDGTVDTMVDAVYFGEGEGAVSRMAASLGAAGKVFAADRALALDALAADTPGLWHSRRIHPVRQALAVPYDGAGDWLPVCPPVFAGEEAGTVRIEITRGCPGFCNFCFEAWERKPFRERSLESILAEARFLKQSTGAGTIELASYNFNAHSRIAAIIRELNSMFQKVNFMSQRADILAGVHGLVRAEVAGDKRSFTLGVEGISKRMRARYNKELEDGELFSVMERLFRENVREIKIFCIIEGSETKEDMADFATAVGQIVRLRNLSGFKPKMVFSVGRLVRMPFTPLAFDALHLDDSLYGPILDAVREIIEGHGFEFREPGYLDEYALSQVLALAPKGCFDLLCAMADRGYTYEQNLSKGAWSFARKFLSDAGSLGLEFFAEKPKDHVFAYSFVEPLVSREFLYQRFLDSRTDTESFSCFGGLSGEKSDPRCAGCAACADDEQKENLTSHRIQQATEKDIARIRSLTEAKRRPFRVLARAKIPMESAGAHPSFSASAHAAAFMALVPRCAESFLYAEDKLINDSGISARLPGAYGSTIMAYCFLSQPDTAAVAAAGYALVDEHYEVGKLEACAKFPDFSLPGALRLVSDFLDSISIAYTLAKSSGSSCFSIPQKSLKKKNVLKVVVSADGENSSAARFYCGAKFDLSALAELARKRGQALELEVLSII